MEASESSDGHKTVIGTLADYEVEYGKELLVSDEDFHSLVESDSENEIEESISDGELQKSLWDSARPLEVNEKSMPLWLGRTFINKAEFKEVVQSYAVDFGKNIKIEKNDNDRCVAICKQEGCKWNVRLRKDKDEECWRITTLNDNHAGCGWVYMNPSISAPFITKRWKETIENNTKWTIQEFRKTINKDDHHFLNKRKAWRALAMARSEIKGEAEQHFNKIWRYCQEIKRTNQKSTCVVKLSDEIQPGSVQIRLLRVYTCWEASKEGFKHCRPIIGVDGCHLKSRYGGMLLTAISVDANEGIFPIAYAMVKGETKETWSWFLQLLKNDLAIDVRREHKLTFMSDKQKGLIPAFEDVLPMVTHRFCVRHLHGNMKVAGFSSKPVRDALWKAARATTMPTFNSAMRELKKLNVGAFDWLGNKHPNQWSRSHFSENAKCDMLVNNISECFNAMIMDARENALLHCLEIIRKKLMVRFFENRETAAKWIGTLCPVIKGKLGVFEKQAGGYWVIQSDEHLFEVSGAYDQHEVDLKAQTCSCRKWELTGIPCRHAICATWHSKGKSPVDSLVDPCYTIHAYLNTYACSIHPIAGADEWPDDNREPPLPPLYTSKVGRPRKLRKKSAGELTKDGAHVSRKHIILHCTICKQRGHNVRKCPYKSCNLPNVQETNTSNNHVEPVIEMQDQAIEIPIQTQPEVEKYTEDEFNVLVEAVNVVVDELNLPVDPLINVGDRIEQHKTGGC